LINPFIIFARFGFFARVIAQKPGVFLFVASFLQQDSLYVALQQNAKRISHEMQ